MLISVILFIFGAIIGSFLNVCIWRMPREESVVAGRSHCPNCRKTIPWYDNIPFLSYVFLGRRCRFCQSKISFRYFLVELLTALTYLAVYFKFGLSIEYLIFIALISALIAATFIDFSHQIIPDEITLGGIVIGLLISFFYPPLHSETTNFASLFASVKGLLAGGVSIYAIGKLGELMFKKESMGGGDVKFLAMIGTILGWQKTLLIFFISPVFGSIVGLIAKFKYKQDIIPYGPYLSIGTIAAIFWGEKLLSLLLVY
ncbi:MAG: prepilin peptidase [Candidatus Omnitrophota bacterium]